MASTIERGPSGISDLTKPPREGLSVTRPKEEAADPFGALVDVFINDQIRLSGEKSFYRADILPTKKLMEVIGAIYAPKIDIEGEENLLEARRQVAEGKKLILISNHLSNLDEATTERAMRLKGFSDICDNLIYLQGIRLDKKLLTRVFLGAFKRIRVWPPTEIPSTEEEKRTCRMMNKESLGSVKKAFSEGYHLFIYPEGGRSYEEQLKKGVPATAHYLQLEANSIILPIAVSGTEKILPVKYTVPPIKNLFVKPVPSVTFCEPLSVDSLVEKYNDFRNSEKNQKIIDDVMKRISTKLPEQYRGVYK